MQEDDNNDLEEYVHEGTVGKEKEKGAQQKKVVTHHRQFSGPLPPPSMLEAYDKVVPGAAERILTMAESEAKHRHNIENSLIKAESREIHLGQIFALIIGLTAILSGTYAATHGAPLAGTLIGAGGVIGLVTVFILGRKAAAPESTAEEAKAADEESKGAE